MEVKAIQIVNYIGCSKPYITKETKNGNLVKNEKNLYDLNNPVNRNWCIKKGVNFNNINDLLTGAAKLEKESKKPSVRPFAEPKIKAAGPEIKPKSNIMTEVTENPSDFEIQEMTGIPEKLLNMSIRDLTLQYGGPLGLKSYVDILDKIFSANKKDVDIQEKRNELIEKDFVENSLLPFINVFMQQIFDYPESVIEQEIAEIKADETKARIDIPQMHRENLSKIAKETNKKLKQQIKELYKKHDKGKE